MACLAVRPSVDGLEKELGDRVTFLRVDIGSEAGENIAAEVGVSSVPGFVAFDRDGKLVGRSKGPGGVGELKRFLLESL